MYLKMEQITNLNVFKKNSYVFLKVNKIKGNIKIKDSNFSKIKILLILYSIIFFFLLFFLFWNN